MAPPKQPAAGMRSIASFFAPKAKAPPKEQLPGIANGAIAPDPSDSPPSADARGATRAAKSAKTSARAAPGSATPGGWDGTTPPAAPSTAVADDEQHARIDPSPPEAESPPGDAPTTATTANGAAGDVGRRIAVLWKSERRYFAGNVAAYDAVNGKHHVRYDDGDDEWIALSRHDVKWDADAEAEAKKKAAPVDDDDDDDDEDDDGSESEEAPPRTKRGRVTARRAAAKALRRVGSKKSGGGVGGGGRPARRAAGAKRKVVLSDSDDDFDAGGDEDASEGGDESESEFEVESEESEDDDDDEASEEESEEEESPGPRGKRGGAKPKPAQPAKKATPKKATPKKAKNPPSSSGGKSLAAALSEPVLAPTGSPELNPAHYEARERLMFPWLQPDKRRDASGRRPSDPEYDPTTLQLPGAFPKCKDATGKPFTVSPGQAQWWRFKAATSTASSCSRWASSTSSSRWTRTSAPPTSACST